MQRYDIYCINPNFFVLFLLRGAGEGGKIFVGSVKKKCLKYNGEKLSHVK
jgi:hypothetical protein